MGSKNTQRRKQHAARAAYAAVKRDVSTAHYWHGGVPGLQPGTELLGRADAEAAGVDLTPYELQAGYALGVTRRDRVYFTSSREFARGYAGRLQIVDEASGVVIRHGALYRVEPIGAIETDPDFPGSGGACCASRARIIKVEEAEVVMDVYGANERIGPHMQWDDGTPVYAANGGFLPSPKMLSAGYTAADFALYPQWVSLEEVNAVVAGVVSVQRFTDVQAAGAAAAEVRTRQFQRATDLTVKGVMFTRYEDSDIGAVNALVGAITNPVSAADEHRGIAVARHPQDGIIGAAVIEASRLASGVTVFVAAVAVTEKWQGHGLGSVLLFTVQQLLPEQATFTAGRCQPQLAPFFTQAGYTVLRQGALLPLLNGEKPVMVDPGSDRCWFYRQTRL